MEFNLDLLNSKELQGDTSDIFSQFLENCMESNENQYNFGTDSTIEKAANMTIFGPGEDIIGQMKFKNQVQSDHDYAKAAEEQTVDQWPLMYDMSSQKSPTNSSDSGLSSMSSRSPASDNRGCSPPLSVQEEHDKKSTLSLSDSDQGYPLLDDLQFDLSDIDMDKVAENFPMANDKLIESCFNMSTTNQNQGTKKPDVLIEFGGLDDSLFQMPSQIMNTQNTNPQETQQQMNDNCVNLLPITIDDIVMKPKEAQHQSSTATKVRCTLPNFKPLVLTDEELKLLEEEEVTIPTDLPLTKYEERILKKVRRKIRNKKSAMESRRRKKDYVGGLEARVSDCTKRNHELSSKVKELEQQNETLIVQLKRLQDAVRNTTTKTTQAATCMMVLLLSCGLLLAPNYGPFSIQSLKTEEGDASDVGSVSSMQSGHHNRKLLQDVVDESPASDDVYTVAEENKDFSFSKIAANAMFHETDYAGQEIKEEAVKISPHITKPNKNDTTEEKQTSENSAVDHLSINSIGKTENAILSETSQWPTSAPQLNVHGNNRALKRPADDGGIPHNEVKSKFARSRLDEM